MARPVPGKSMSSVHGTTQLSAVAIASTCLHALDACQLLLLAFVVVACAAYTFDICCRFATSWCNESYGLATLDCLWSMLKSNWSSRASASRWAAMKLKHATKRRRHLLRTISN